MTVRRDNEGRPSLTCARKRALRKAACDNQNVYLNQLHEAILDHLLGHVLTDDFLEEQVSLVAQKSQESVAQDNRKVASLKRRMTQNRSSSRNLTLTLEVNGPNQDVSDRVNELREEYNKLDNQLHIQQESMKTRAAFVNTPDVLVRGYVDQVVISCGSEVIARHPRPYQRDHFVYDPIHQAVAGSQTGRVGPHAV